MTSTALAIPSLQALEVRWLTEGILEQSGHDFRDYSMPGLYRRIVRCVECERTGSITQLLARTLRDRACLARVVAGLTVNYSEMFRDPSFFSSLRHSIVHHLPGEGLLKFWVTGCAGGEEAYSLAIVLTELGVYERSRIYATDISEGALVMARAGEFSLAPMRKYTENYMRAGGARAFSDYYKAGHGHALFDPSLARNMLFATHNLATDSSFNAFHAILCRNVMIYFNRRLQARVLELLLTSLEPNGLLGVGRQETLRLSPVESRFERLGANEGLYRRIFA